MSTYTQIETEVYEQVLFTLQTSGHKILLDQVKASSHAILNCMAWNEGDARNIAANAMKEGKIREDQIEGFVAAAIESFQPNYQMHQINFRLMDFLDCWVYEQEKASRK